jgi:hypothetical protein
MTRRRGARTSTQDTGCPPFHAAERLQGHLALVSLRSFDEFGFACQNGVYHFFSEG